tara:strand:+ start:801 stop:1007 length:207 start_codon:yes stop_codon:yes gene_type:complete
MPKDLLVETDLFVSRFSKQGDLVYLEPKLTQGEVKGFWAKLEDLQKICKKPIEAKQEWELTLAPKGGK